MNEAFLLYLVTRLHPLHELAVVSLVFGGITAAVGLFIGHCERDEDILGFAKKIVKWLPLSVAVLVLVPDKDDTMFIVAGTGVIEAAKSDQAQRIAGKSVQLIEDYLDKALKEEKK